MLDRETIDKLWSQALYESVKHREPTTRHRFAALVAAAEREACALVAEDMCEYGKPFSAAAAIRARGETI